MAQEPLRLHTGKKLGPYELLAPAARGGAGPVWAARLRGARGFHKLVATKVLAPFGASPGVEQQLLEQAHVAALIQHSNVVQTLELGEQEGRLYLVMEWVDGEPLSTVLECAAEGGGVPLLIAVNWIAQALRGLQAAHELSDELGVPLGIVHGALSPPNLLVSYSGTVKLINFAIAAEPAPVRLRGSDPGYLAPEQISGGIVDRRSDLFAIGVMLYELTTGRHPFDAQNTAQTRSEPALLPSRLTPNYSRTLEAVLMKALEFEPERRWPSAEEMRLALQRGVPQAFELGFETQVRNFMGDTVGERAARKREALHRAEQGVDARANDAGSRPPSTSVSSLRALAIDNQEQPTSSVPGAEQSSPLRPRLGRSVPPPQLRVPVLLGLLAALIYGLFSVLTGHRAERAVAAPNSGMVELTPARAPKPPSRVVAPASAFLSAPSASRDPALHKSSPPLSSAR